MPEVSIVVPVYRVMDYLRDCVDSILAQTFHDIQVVLVDDGSPDACGEICDMYERVDSRVHVIHQKNGGLSSARNAGIDWVGAHGGSKWIYFVDGDDAISPNAIEVLYKAAIRFGVKIAVGGFLPVDNLKKVEHTMDCAFHKLSVHDFWISAGTKRVVAWGKLYAFDLFSDVRYPVGMIHEDELTTPWLLFKVDVLALTEATLYYYLRRTSSITRAVWTPARLAAVDAERKKREYFLSLGHFDLAAEADARLIALLGVSIRQSRSGKYQEYSSMLRKVLLEELSRIRRYRSIPIGDNYWCYHALCPWLVNRYTWILFRGLYLILHGKCFAEILHGSGR